MHDSLAALDAFRHYDPTGTTDLRARFRGDMDRRWGRLKRQAAQAITGADDLLGLGGRPQAYLRAADPIRGFQAFIDSALTHLILGGGNGLWTQIYLDEAAARARSRAFRIAPLLPGGGYVENNHHLVLASTAAELHGIAEAVSQQAARAISQGLL